MGFREDLDQDPISSLALRDARAVSAETTLREAIELMRASSLGCVVIVDDSGAPTGLFTEQALIDALAQSDSLDDRTVGQHAAPEFLAVRLSEPVRRVWTAIEHDGLRFVCVTDDAGKFQGVTGQRGIAEYLAECFPQQVLVQRLGSTPWMNQREGA